MSRSESRQFHMSVEGANCERLYFEHLAKLINCSGQNKYITSVVKDRKVSGDEKSRTRDGDDAAISA